MKPALAIAALALAAPAMAQESTPVCDTREACALIVSQNGMLAQIGPMQTQAEVEGLIAANPDLTVDEQEQLRAIGRAHADKLGKQALTAETQAYASALSLADLQAMAAWVQSDAAQRARAAMPQIMMGVMQQMQGVDYLGTVRADFCNATGKLCDSE